MLDAAEETRMPHLSEHASGIEAAGSHLARALAAHLGIAVKYPATWEGKAFGGTCAAFGPVHPDQPCPTVIEDGDRGGDWE